jgi:CRISPR/Cas system-associated exonuclease Cas4 (RecB family)
MINEVLQENLSRRPEEVALEDVIKHCCGYRHYLQLSEAEADRPEPPGEILLRETARVFRGSFMKKYLKGCFEDFSPIPVKRLAGAVSADFLGMIDCDLVEFYTVSTKAYGNLPKRLQIAAATKAHLLGADAAWVITLDRNSQDWTSWRIDGAFDELAELVLHDVGFIAGLLKGESEKLGTADPNATCIACPYVKVCDADRIGDVPSFPVKSLHVKQDLSLVKKLDEHLWTLNEKDQDGRATHCIHPSEFATAVCDRRIALGLQGVKRVPKIPPNLRRIFDMGHAFHEVIQTSLKWALGEEFADEVEVNDKKLKITGHCDGVFASIREGLEIKSISVNGFKKLTNAKAEHRRQATMYSVILEMVAVRYLYACKEHGGIEEFRVKLNPKEWQRLAERASNINKSVSIEKLPPKIDKEYVCRECDFVWKCRPELTKTKNIRRRL